MSEEITTSHFHLTESTRVISSRMETVYTGSECSSTLPSLQNAAQELSSSTSSSIRNLFEGDEYVLDAQSEQTVDGSNDGQSAQPRDQKQLVESGNGEHAAQSVQLVQPVQPREEQPASTSQESGNTPATNLVVRSDVRPYQ